jgi:hypothetical protein
LSGGNGSSCNDLDGNIIYIANINDDGDGNVIYSLNYSFEDEVAGFEFDFLSDSLLITTGVSGGDASIVFDSISTNSYGKVIGFSMSAETMSPGEGHLLDLIGIYDTDNSGISVCLGAIETCDDDGTIVCEEGDTRLVLASSDALALESEFEFSEWTIGESDSDPSICYYTGPGYGCTDSDSRASASELAKTSLVSPSSHTIVPSSSHVSMAPRHTLMPELSVS